MEGFMRGVCCSVLPPHILSKIASSKTVTPVLRATAIDSLNLTNSLTSLRIGYDESLRTTRQQLRVQRLQAIQAQFQSATAGSPQRTIFSAGNSQTIPGTQVLTEGGTPPSD